MQTNIRKVKSTKCASQQCLSPLFVLLFSSSNHFLIIFKDSSKAKRTFLYISCGRFSGKFNSEDVFRLPGNQSEAVKLLATPVAKGRENVSQLKMFSQVELLLLSTCKHPSVAMLDYFQGTSKARRTFRNIFQNVWTVSQVCRRFPRNSEDVFWITRESF